MIDIETLRLKIRNYIYIPLVKNHFNKCIKTRDFTIISNNCWGGTIYETYNLPKASPTIGMFIMPADYIEFLRDFDRYIAMPIEFITMAESKWQRELSFEDGKEPYIIGRLGSVELHMLHYHNEGIARRKWESRVKRINREKIIFKFNDQNGCTEEQAREFDSLMIANKLFFSVKDIPGVASCVRIKSPKKHEFIRASYEPMGSNKCFNVHSYLRQVFSS